MDSSLLASPRSLLASVGAVDFDQPPVVRISARDDHGLAPGAWPRTVPAVEQLLADGLTLSKGVTFLVGENGSG